MKGSLTSDDKVLFDGGFRRATAALGRHETVVLDRTSHEILTAPNLMTSASKNHNQSEITTAIYSTNKIAIGGLDHTECDKIEVKTNEVSDTAALNDGQYISLLATIAQKQTDNLQYPLVSNKFLKKMITTHNQCALVPSAPVQLSHVTGKKPR